jgi:hypothetical protein
MQAIGHQDDTVESYRERLRKMSDQQLIETGKAARYMCSRKANLGQPPLEIYVVHLREARAEWRRRHPK